jgi:hypothetical protein
MKVAAVPQIDGLTVDDFLEYASRKPVLMKHLPDPAGWNHHDKKWICDVLYTLDEPGIKNLVANAMQARKDKLEHSQDLMVEMRPEFAEALKKSINFSSK